LHGPDRYPGHRSKLQSITCMEYKAVCGGQFSAIRFANRPLLCMSPQTLSKRGLHEPSYFD
jgi:hypothetical protein